MAEVHAIKDPQTISMIGHLLEIRFSKQMAHVWKLGINLALRVSDLLNLRFDDIQNDRIHVIEKKTGKLASIKLNDKALTIINEIKTSHPTHDYLFQSYRCNQTKFGIPKPLSRRAVTHAFQEVGHELKLALGTHSMRKTRGYHLYKQSKDLGRVMKMLRHSSEGVTLRYIGITQEEVDHDFVSLEL
ncbi:tyrosine-type recombinase/integrase [Pseudoalteromonas sp. T1lg75]|uniref:tyrosine-type recombinase/integrase n=1 Tax=Pseudoalteromonas sp. T1lg75 TaxID=2077102 RepID=UPI000CF692BE|nr:tyrosine-type recombinase/integrase [Pseudoalteromonas sp. T1lg75]